MSCEGHEGFPGGCIPEARGMVVRCGHDLCAIGTEGGSMDGLFMPREGGEGFPGDDVPETDSGVFRMQSRASCHRG
jgi:hypothetical protein